MNKIMSMREALGFIEDGDILGIGGNVLHRSPMGLVRGIVKAGKKELKIIKTAGAMDVDMLCLGGCVASVDAGFISYESEFGLAKHYRSAVESGIVQANEHACYTVICALRAAAYGVPFMPVKGLVEGDLIKVNNYFAKIRDPFKDEEITVVKEIKPDVVILHAQKADKSGNIYILGPKFEDILLAKAGKKVIVSAETIVEENFFSEGIIKADIPHFMVSAVVPLKNGAMPCSCYGYYNIDRASIKAFKKLKTERELKSYIDLYNRMERGNIDG